MSNEIIVTIISSSITIIAILFSNYLGDKSKLEFEKRKQKEESYNEFLKSLSEATHTHDAKNLSAAFNKMYLTATPKVLQAIENYLSLIMGFKNDSITQEDCFNDIIREMRADLLTNKDSMKALPKFKLIRDSRYLTELEKDNG